ncbi:MAG TPA: hypothetical protein VI520_00725 [Anaerolineales bacterium]|nr:hypothetical protein [Anaerolineales bacterium]
MPSVGSGQRGSAVGEGAGGTAVDAAVGAAGEAEVSEGVIGGWPCGAQADRTWKAIAANPTNA